MQQTAPFGGPNPPTGTPNDYEIYVHTGTTPPTLYVALAGAWLAVAGPGAALQGESLTLTGQLTVPGGAAPIIETTAAITSGAGVGAGTLTNAPTAGNPTKFIPIDDNGTTRYIPAW